MTGGGVAILYLTAWASFALYGMVPGPVAFAFLVGVTALAAGLALRYDSVALAVLATLGGFLNPIVVGRGAIDVVGVYAYTVALDLGVFALASVRRWGLLDKVAFAGSWTLYGLAQASGGRGMIFATTIFVLFGSLPYLRSVVRGRPSQPADVIQMTTNAAVYYAVSFANLSPDQTGPFTLTLSGVFLGQGLAVFGIAEGDRLLRLGALGVAVALFTLWIFLEADPTWLPALWAAVGLGLTLIGYRVHSGPTRLAGASVVALSFVATLYSFEDFFPERLLLSEEALVYVSAIAVLYAVAFVTSRIPAERPYRGGRGKHPHPHLAEPRGSRRRRVGPRDDVQYLGDLGGVRCRAARDRDRGPPEVSAVARHRHLRRHPDQDGRKRPVVDRSGPPDRVVRGHRSTPARLLAVVSSLQARGAG